MGWRPLSRLCINITCDVLSQLRQPLWGQYFHGLSTVAYSMVFPFRLYVNWRFMRGIEAQFLALQKGFNELIPQHLLKPFDQKELEVSEATGNPVCV